MIPTYNPSTVGHGGLYQREDVLSPVRAAEALIGVAAIGWGGPRLQMVGPMLRRGQRVATSAQAKRAFGAAESTRAGLEDITRGPGRRFARTRPGRVLYGATPPALRGEAATLAGLALVEHAKPVRSTTYKPVQGW